LDIAKPEAIDSLNAYIEFAGEEPEEAVRGPYDDEDPDYI
jgi:hypothetical protein